MPRKPRVDIKGNYYHCMNRANARLKINFTETDYLTFLEVIKESCEIFKIDVLAFVLMPNHFHLVIYTKQDGEMGKFMHWLTLTYTQRWHKKYNTIGHGHLFQGRYKSVLIKDQRQLEVTVRYVERNPLTSNLVKNILDWRYSSLFQIYGNEANHFRVKISKTHYVRPNNYLKDLIQDLTIKESDHSLFK